MKNIYLKETKDSPLIILNAEENEYILKGNSVKHAPDAIYELCISWFEEMLPKIKYDININFSTFIVAKNI